MSVSEGDRRRRREQEEGGGVFKYELLAECLLRILLGGRSSRGNNPAPRYQSKQTNKHLTQGSKEGSSSPSEPWKLGGLLRPAPSPVHGLLQWDTNDDDATSAACTDRYLAGSPQRRPAPSHGQLAVREYKSRSKPTAEDVRTGTVKCSNYECDSRPFGTAWLLHCS